MERLKKIGSIIPKSSAEISDSRLGIGFEKLDRGVFDPEKAYDKVAAIGVKWVRIQSGWARTEKEKGVYEFSIETDEDHDIRRNLFALLARKGWPLLSLRNTDLTLEDVFLRLTSGDTAYMGSNKKKEKGGEA